MKLTFYILTLIGLIDVIFSLSLPSDIILESVQNSIPIKKYIAYNATFYSRQETNNNLPASGVRGSTLKEAQRGYGLLQVSVNPNQIPLFSRLTIMLWDQTTVTGIALDVGPTKTIDIYVDTIAEAINLGVKKVMLEITAI